MASQKYQVLARRYRPRRFSEVVGQESAVTTLKNALRFDKVAHAYLFCGSRGVGKTTLARLFAKALNCLEKNSDMEPCNECPSCKEIGAGQSLDVIEIDGASNRGIDDIRQINETALYSPSSGRYKIYIIDEVHMLTKEAFNALLKTLEEPPEKAKFFFATTEPHKVLPTIVSRCQRFDLGRIQLSQIIAKLEEIASDLKRKAEPEALHLIATFSDGSLRDAESLFDQILCFAEGIITGEVIRNSLGLIPQDHFFALDQAFSEARAAFAFELVETLFVAGKDLSHFYEQLIEHVRNLSSVRLLGEKGLSLPPDLAARYLHSSRLYASSQCLYLLEFLLRQEAQLQKSACQRAALEAILLHYIQSKHRIPMEVLVRRLSEMEEALKALPKEDSSPLLKEMPLPDLPPVSSSEPKLVQELCALSKLDASPQIAKTVPLPRKEVTPPPLSLEPKSIQEFQPREVKIPLSSRREEANLEPIHPEEKPIRELRPLSLKPVPFNPFKKPISKESINLNSESDPTQGSFRESLADFSSKIEPAVMISHNSEENKPKTIQAIDLPENQIHPPTPEISPSKKIAALEKPKHQEEKKIELEDKIRYETLMRFATVELEGSLKLT